MRENWRWFAVFLAGVTVLLLLQEFIYDRAGRPMWAAALLSVLTLALVGGLAVAWQRRGPRSRR